MPILTPREREHFFDQGFLVIDPGIPMHVIDGVIQDMEGRYPAGNHRTDGYQGTTRVQDAWHQSRNAHAIAVAPRVLDALRELYGREALPFQTLNFPVGTEQRPHSDAVHFNSCPPTFMCGVWVALEDVDEKNGSVQYYPGSNKLPEVDLNHVGKEPAEANYSFYEDMIERVIQKHGLKPQVARLKKGQAFVWSSNLIHAGSRRLDPKRTRHSQVTHYYFEGCRYFTPMLSRAEEVFWRNPAFIPRKVPGVRPWSAWPK